jgi:uncharacterized protein YpmS
MHRTPSWYRPLSLNSKEMEAAANRAFDKAIAIHNMAADAASRESSAQYAKEHGRPAPATNPAAPITVSFTQEELTAFIVRWSTLNSEKVERYITGPQFALKDGQIIFGGHITQLGQFGAIYLDPSIDEKGLLHLDVVQIRAGDLRVPQQMVQSHVEKLETSLRQWLPQWQRKATLDTAGANADTVKAAMTELLLNTIHEKPSQAIFFMPIGDRKTVPVRLTNVAINDASITFTVQPLGADERKLALDNIREPFGTATATSN